MRLCAFIVALLFAAQAHAASVGGAYDSDAQAYFNTLIANSCTTPTPAFKLAVSNYIKAERTAGNWGSQDAEYILTTTDQCTSGVNLAQPNLYKVTWAGACTPVLQTGYSGDGATCDGDIGVTQAALKRIAQNNAHEDVWVKAANVACCAFGLATGGNNFRVSAVTNRVMVLNSSQANGITDNGTGIGGLYFADRINSSTVITTGSNGATQNVGAASTSVALVATNPTICHSGSAFCPAGENVLFVGFGAAMNDEASHYTNVRTMLLALGVTGI